MIEPVGIPAISVPVRQGVYSEVFLADQHQKSQELVNIRDQRRNNPGWNTLKEVIWAPLTSYFQLGQAIGSFSGHVVIALPAALLGGALGLCIYAPLMKALDCIIGRENAKSFSEYVITPANLLSNIAYNRVTDVLSRYILGPAILVAVVEPLLYLAVASSVAVVLSPFIYHDFASNNSQNVERFIDKPLNSSVKWGVYHHLWQKFDDLVAGKPRSLQDRDTSPTDVYLLADQLRPPTLSPLSAAAVSDRSSEPFHQLLEGT